MKKIRVLYVFLCCAVFLYAQDKPLRFIELGFDVDAAFANSFVSVGDIFNKERTFALDLNELAEQDLGLGVNAKAAVVFNVNVNSGLGFGIFASVKADTLGMIPHDLLSLLAEGNANNSYLYSDTMRLNANIFADLGLRVYKRFDKLKLTVLPALFLPLAYIPEPSLLYTIDTRNGISIHANADADLYTPISIESLMNGGGIDINEALGALPESYGMDLSFNAEYELSPKFYLGASIINFPLSPATLNHKTRYTLKDGFNFEEDQLLESMINGSLINKISNAVSGISVEPEYNNGAGYKAARPIRFDFYTVSRPLHSNLLLLKANIGFSIVNTSSIETWPALIRQFKLPEAYYYFNIGYGLYVHLGRFATMGAEMAYQEQIWKYRFDLGLNLHFIQIDLGVSLQSIAQPTKDGFLDSIKLSQTKGIGVNLGFRLGI